MTRAFVPLSSSSPLALLRGAMSFIIWAALWPTQVDAQQMAPPRLPELDKEAASAVGTVLTGYYDYWRDLPPGPRYPCDADLGQDCFGRDIDGGCNSARRCRSETEMVEFVGRLADLVEQYPESPLPLSHAVYAAVKLGYLDLAGELVEACASGGEGDWWCNLATGFVLHRSGRSADSERYFERALDAMPPPIGCGLENVLVLLPEDLIPQYSALGCDARSDAHRWFWWAVDPFLVDAGNDRRAEHLARGFQLMVNQDLNDRVRSVNVFRPRGYNTSYILRGFPDSRDVRSRRFGGRVRVTTILWTSRRAAFNHFVPEVLALRGIHDELHYRIASDIEYLQPARNPGNEGYTRQAGFVSAVPVQIARFRQADSLMVAIASEIDTATLGSEGEAWFVASEGPGHVVTLDPAPLRQTVRFAGKVANRKQVVGVEVFTPGADARHRSVLQPLDSAMQLLSDVLLFAPLTELPASRVEAVARMYGSVHVPEGERLGIYWESYGFAAGETLRASLRLEKEGGGIFAGLARAIGLAGGDEHGAVSWTETVQGEGPFVQTLTLDLSNVVEGEYDLVVEIEGADGVRLTRTRRFEVSG